MFFMLPCTQLLLQWTDKLVGGRWMVGAMEDFSGGKDLSKISSQYAMFVDAVASTQVTH